MLAGTCASRPSGLAISIDYGMPIFTGGVFGYASAQDDLGVEEVGAGLLRRLIPGVIQNTPNAGYYSFYPYLLWKWEQLGGAIERKAFIPFYRRHEATLSVACALHSHRDGVQLSGVNGALTSRQRARRAHGGRDALDLASHAERYMDTPLGGYGLFYAAALQDARLVTGGASGLVDRVTEHGAAVARAFAETFEQTPYFRDYFDEADEVPARGAPRARRRRLSVHRPRPQRSPSSCSRPSSGSAAQLSGVGGAAPCARRRASACCSSSTISVQHGARDDLAAWRRALIDPRFSDGTAWMTSASRAARVLARLPVARDRGPGADDDLEPVPGCACGPRSRTATPSWSTR